MSQSIIKFNEDHTYNVANVQIRSSRQHNAHRPNTQPRCEEILLTIVSPGEDAGFLLNWYINNSSEDADLYLNIRSRELNDCDRHFHLENSYCFSIEEVYDNAFSRRHLIQLGIVAGRQTLMESNTKDYTIKSF